jgi:hypothetical protein
MKRAPLVASAAFVASVAVGWIWLTVPYLEVMQARIDDRPVDLRAAFSNETSDPLCTKLYELVDGRISNKPIFSRVATDISDPNEATDLKDGDQIVLRGYRYERRERNRITGHEVKRRDGRVDVIGWSGPSGVEHHSTLDPRVQTTFGRENYIGCR